MKTLAFIFIACSFFMNTAEAQWIGGEYIPQTNTQYVLVSAYQGLDSAVIATVPAQSVIENIYAIIDSSFDAEGTYITVGIAGTGVPPSDFFSLVLADLGAGNIHKAALGDGAYYPCYNETVIRLYMDSFLQGRIKVYVIYRSVK